MFKQLFLAYKISKCQFYDLLDGFYGCKANVTVPYLYDSLQKNKKTGEMQTFDESSQNNVDTNVEMQTNAESSQNNVDSNVIGEIVVNGDGDVVESSL